MKKNVEKFMVKSPLTGSPGMNLIEALAKMQENNIRHLPIVEAGKLVGIVSKNDLRSYTALQLTCPLLVSDVMKDDVYVAKKSSSLREVVRTMKEKKLGSTIVVNSLNEVVGIFTVIDALELLSDFLDHDSSEEYVVDDCYEPWNFGESLNSPY